MKAVAEDLIAERASCLPKCSVPALVLPLIVLFKASLIYVIRVFLELVEKEVFC